MYQDTDLAYLTVVDELIEKHRSINVTWKA